MIPSEKKILLAVLAGILILVGFAFFVISPLIDQIQQTADDYLSAKGQLAQLAQKEFQVKELEDEYDQHRDKLSLIGGAFLNSEEIVGLIATLENIAIETGNVFEIKSVASPLEKDTFLSFQISLRGNFNSILEFVANLEDNPYPPYRLMEIEQLVIKRLSGATLSEEEAGLEEGNLEASLGIKIYRHHTPRMD